MKKSRSIKTHWLESWRFALVGQYYRLITKLNFRVLWLIVEVGEVEFIGLLKPS
jgi:hypothetical protein